MRKELNISLQKNQLKIKVIQDISNKNAVIHIENKQQNDGSKFLFINNNFKHKQTKLPNQKVEVGGMIKIHVPTICVYKRLTSEPKSQMDLKKKDRKRYCKQREIKTG